MIYMGDILGNILYILETFLIHSIFVSYKRITLPTLRLMQLKWDVIIKCLPYSKCSANHMNDPLMSINSYLDNLQYLKVINL